MDAATLPELPKLVDLDDPDFDVFQMEKALRGDYDDVYPVIEKLRQQGSVHKGEYRMLFTDVPDVEVHHLQHYMVLGYDACQRVLMDGETFGNYDAFKHNLGKSFGNTVTVMDGAQHAMIRKVLQKAFLPNVVSRWGDSLVQPVIDKLMNKFIDKGKADLVEDYTHHFPFQIVYSMLLLDAEEAPIFHRLAVAQLLSSGGHPQGRESTRKLGEFFQVMIDRRRANPGDDLVSHLVTCEVDGKHIPDDVLVSFFRQLLNAGGDTTYRATSVLLTKLLEKPELFEEVKNDRSLVPLAIEEALRWDGPVTTTYRWCKKDTEIDGVVIPKDTMVNVVLGSANRDPTKYENPDEFDIHRERSVRHLAFASGPHICVGQHLARVEMTRALEGVFDNLPNVRLDPDMPPPRIKGGALRAPDHIYVRFDAR